jgi:c-di-GMP-binding flagellar brake protein YcgR
LGAGTVSGTFNDELFRTTGAGKPIDQPLNIQCRVFEIVKEPNQRLDCKALSMQGDTIHLKFSWRGRYSSCPVKKGTWVSVYADYKDEKYKWVCRKIKINN